MDKAVTEACKCAFKMNNIKIIMPLQKTNLDSPTMRCTENTQKIHRTPTPKCDPNKTA